MTTGCGCGGGKGGSGGCGSSVKEPLVAEVVAQASFEELKAPELIASSEQEWPIISVNGVPVTPQAMAMELQYHPADSREEAVYSAARALVIRELLQQRIAELGLAVEIAAGENEEEAATRLLLEREVTVPECDEAIDGGVPDENPAYTTPEDRHLHFGQWDHVRLYTRELFTERLEQAGLDVELFNAFESLPEEAKALRLNPLERLRVARNPVTS